MGPDKEVDVSEVRLAEDRPRNIIYKEGDIEVSLIFGWAQPGNTPTSVKIAIRVISNQENLAVSNEPTHATWTSFDEAEAEGRRVASDIISKRSHAREVTRVQIHQVVYRSDVAQ